MITLYQFSYLISLHHIFHHISSHFSVSDATEILASAIDQSEVPVILDKNDPYFDPKIPGFSGDIRHYPLAVRRRVLKRVIRTIEGRFELSQCSAVTSLDTNVRRKQLEDYFNLLTLAGEEGLVVKDLTSRYELGELSGKIPKWVKMKPEYGDQTTDLDLVVIGESTQFMIIFV